MKDLFATFPTNKLKIPSIELSGDSPARIAASTATTFTCRPLSLLPSNAPIFIEAEAWELRLPKIHSPPPLAFSQGKKNNHMLFSSLPLSIARLVAPQFNIWTDSTSIRTS